MDTMYTYPNLRLSFIHFFSDSAADTSLVDDCPDPYATEITTVAPSTKGKPKKSDTSEKNLVYYICLPVIP